MYEGHGVVYRPSGRLGRSLFVMPIIGMFGTLIAAVVYACATDVTIYTSIASYVSILFVGGYAFVLASVVAQAGYLSKCRNPEFLRLAGFLTGLFGVYCSWAAYVYVLAARHDFLSPGATIDRKSVV